MSSPTFDTVILQLFTLVDQILNNYVYHGYSVLASHLQTPLGLAMTLYIMVMALAVMQGWIQCSVGSLSKSIVKMVMVYCFAMHWDLFSQYAVNGLEGGVSTIGNWMITASPIPIPHFAGEGIDGALQSVMIEVTKVGAWTWDMGGITHLGPLFVALVIWALGYLGLIFAVMEILLAKIMLAVLFTVAPLMIAMTLFKPTQGIFDKWIGTLCGFSCVMIFVPTTVTLCLSLMQWVVGSYYVGHAVGVHLVSFVVFLVVGYLCVRLIREVTTQALYIGGAATGASGSSMLAAGVGSFLGSATGVWAGLRAAAPSGLKAAKAGGFVGKAAGLGTYTMMKRLIPGRNVPLREDANDFVNSLKRSKK